MSEMIERLALAIWREREIGFPPRVRRFNPDELDRESGAWAACMREARALVETMREPTETMIKVGNDAGCWDRDFSLDDGDADQVWQAMIDEALR